MEGADTLHLVNMSDHVPPDAAGLCLLRTQERMENFVRKQPVRAAALVFGAGLLFECLPPRFAARALGAVAARIVTPTLLGLGMLKAFELCCRRNTQAGS